MSIFVKPKFVEKTPARDPDTKKPGVETGLDYRERLI